MPELTDERRALYERLESQVIDTPLYRLHHIPVPRECKIFCKEEHRNPTGTHYDRQTVRLLRGLEEEGRISPGWKRLAETTTGSSGASFAWMCRVLGYTDCIVFIPEDMPSARIEQIRSFGADVRFAPEQKYIRGLVSTFRDFISHTREPFVATNHSKDDIYAPQAMGAAAVEVVRDLRRQGHPPPDFFVAALGNGVSARGMADVLEPLGTHTVGMEPYESPDVLHEVFPDVFARMYPDGHPTGPHEVYGTGPGEDTGTEFPNIDAIKDRLVEIRLPREEQWRPVQRQLLDIEGKHVGNSSAACVWAALDLAADENTPPGSTILTVFYDAYWRYLPLSHADGSPPRHPPSGDPSPSGIGP